MTAFWDSHWAYHILRHRIRCKLRYLKDHHLFWNENRRKFRQTDLPSGNRSSHIMYSATCFVLEPGEEHMSKTLWLLKISFKKKAFNKTLCGKSFIICYYQNQNRHHANQLLAVYISNLVGRINKFMYGLQFRLLSNIPTAEIFSNKNLYLLNYDVWIFEANQSIQRSS